MKVQNLPLLSSSPDDFRLQANQMIDLADSIEARVRLELPRLRALGSKVVAIINAEYLGTRSRRQRIEVEL
jgi:hypothetical protein